MVYLIIDMVWLTIKGLPTRAHCIGIHHDYYARQRAKLYCKHADGQHNIVESVFVQIYLKWKCSLQACLHGTRVVVSPLF